MKMLCDQAIRCPGSDFPVSNFSSEDPDREIFISINWGWDYTNTPPLGPNWPTGGPNKGGDPGCVVISESVVSQQEADQCSLVAQIQCADGRTAEVPVSIECGGSTSNPNPPPSDPGPPLFSNRAQSCQSACPDGSFNTFTVRAGYFVARSQDLADRMAKSYACRQARINRICIGDFDGVSCADPDAINPPFNAQLSASSALGIVSFQIVSGSLPPDIVMGPHGELTGRTTTPGTYQFTVKVTNGGGNSATKAMEWNVIGITNDASLPDAQNGVAYSLQLHAAGGGFIFAIVDGALPDGLTMDDAGLISGVPTTLTTDQEFTVSVSDNFLHSCTKQFLISVLTGCVADTCGTPPAVPSNFVAIPLSIPDWNTSKLAMVAAADPAGAQPEWDGTLPVPDRLTLPGFIFYLPAGSVPPGGFVALAFNGYLGDTNGINISEGGVGGWFLAFSGFVGGVPTVIWQGVKLVGSGPAGTYMRDTGGTPGIASGPDCFVVQGPPCEPMAWWSFDDDANNPVDSECGLIATDDGINVPMHTLVGGKVGQALRINPFGIASAYNHCTNTRLRFTNGGFTAAFWLYLLDSSFDINSTGGFEYSFLVGGVLKQVIIARNANTGNWDVTAPGSATISIPYALLWQFLVLKYDAVNGILSFSMNNGAFTNTACTPLTPDAGSAATVFISATTKAGPANEVMQFDELGVFDGLLTAAQITVLYNGSAGKGYPP